MSPERQSVKALLSSETKKMKANKNVILYVLSCQ
jgi:hypothetical protein